MIETILADLITKSVILSTGRLYRQLRMNVARRRDGKPENAAVNDLLSIERAVDSKRFLGVNLPSGFDQARLRSFMEDATSSAVVFETISARLVGVHAAELAKIRERWKINSTPLLPLLSEEQRNSFINQLFTVVCEEAEYIATSMEERHPDMVARLQENARHNRLYAIMEALEKRSASYQLSDAEKAIADHEWLKIYRSQAEAAHGHLTPPDFDRRRSVPISDLYVSPSIASRIGQQRIDTFGLADRIDRTVLLGDPGGGKTTASTVIMHHFATSPDCTVPFIVILREFASDGKTDKSVVEHLQSRLNTKYQCGAPEGTVERLFESGKALVVFDGLDELLDTSLRRDVADAVTLFCNRYPLARVLVTSRSVGYDQAALDPRTFSEWEIAGFDDDRVREYVNKWFKQDESLDEKSAQEWSDAFVEESNDVSDLRTNPLLLALMCIIYRGEQSLPKNRPAVYEKCATMLFEKWDSHRRIHSSLQVGPLVDPAMKYLAYWMIVNPDTSEGVTESRLVGETTTYLKTRTFEDELEAEAAAREFVEFCRGRAWVFSDVGTTADGEPLYRFTHRTFMEYFAAYHLARRNDSPEKLGRQLAKRVANAEWDVIAQLAVQIADKHTDSGADRIFRLILSEKVKRTPQNRGNQLAFLARCLSFAVVSPASIRDLTRQSLENVFSLTAIESMRPEQSALIPLFASRMPSPTREFVADEFSRVIDARLGSRDRNDQKRALFVAAGSWLSCHFSLGRGHNRIYWRDRSLAILDAHRDKVVAFANEDSVFRFYAALRGYGGVIELYNLQDAELSPIFSPTLDRLYSVGLWAVGQSLFEYWVGVPRFLDHATAGSRLSLGQLGELAARDPKAALLDEEHRGNIFDMVYSGIKAAVEDVSPPDATLTPQEQDGLALLFFIVFELLENVLDAEALAKFSSRASRSEYITSLMVARSAGGTAPSAGSRLTAEPRRFMERWSAKETSVLRLSEKEWVGMHHLAEQPYIANSCVGSTKCNLGSECIEQQHIRVAGVRSYICITCQMAYCDNRAVEV